MSFALELVEDDYILSGWTGFRSQKEAEKQLDTLRKEARETSARFEIPLSVYRIHVLEHGPDCPGTCPDEQGYLTTGCDHVAEYPIDPQ